MSVRLQYLLDTNVISETRKNKANHGVQSFLERVHSSSLFISVLTLGEVRKGISSVIASDPAAAKRLSSWLDGLEYSFADRIHSVDARIARIWGELSARKTRPAIDTLIAATALQHDLTLVTRNTGDFAGTSVKLFNPWKD